MMATKGRGMARIYRNLGGRQGLYGRREEEWHGNKSLRTEVFYSDSNIASPSLFRVGEKPTVPALHLISHHLQQFQTTRPSFPLPTTQNNSPAVTRTTGLRISLVFHVFHHSLSSQFLISRKIIHMLRRILLLSLFPSYSIAH